MRKILSAFAILHVAFVSSQEQGGSLRCSERCKCAQNYIPFCGSDGVTYPNKCRLECAREFCDSSLRVRFEGVCAVPYRHDEWKPFRKPSYGFGNQNYQSPVSQGQRVGIQNPPKRYPSPSPPLRPPQRYPSSPQLPPINRIPILPWWNDSKLKTSTTQPRYADWLATSTTYRSIPRYSNN